MKKNEKIQPGRGFTLIEVLIAGAVFVILVVYMYNMVSRSMETAAFATAKGVAKDQSEIILRQLERDISSSIVEYSNSTKEYEITFSSSPGSWKMKTAGDGPTAAPINVEYTFNATDHTLSRKNDGPKPGDRIISSKVGSLTLDLMPPPPTPAPQVSSQILVTVETGVIPEGRTQMQIHQQQLLVTIKSILDANADKRWKDPNNIQNNY